MSLPPTVSAAAYQAAHSLLADLQMRLGNALHEVKPPDRRFWTQFDRDVLNVRRLLGDDE